MFAFSAPRALPGAAGDVHRLLRLRAGKHDSTKSFSELDKLPFSRRIVSQTDRCLTPQQALAWMLWQEWGTCAQLLRATFCNSHEKGKGRKEGEVLQISTYVNLAPSEARISPGVNQPIPTDWSWSSLYQLKIWLHCSEVYTPFPPHTHYYLCGLQSTPSFQSRNVWVFFKTGNYLKQTVFKNKEISQLSFSFFFLNKGFSILWLLPWKKSQISN